MSIILIKVANESWLHRQVVDFALRYGLNTWDWVALIITSFSLMIAIISVVIATKTLKSQKETQKNTQPIMNLVNQEFLIGQKLLCILDSYIYLFALQFFLTKHDYKVKPSSHFWQITEISLDDLNESLFYNENEKFIEFNWLKTVIKEFNTNIMGLKEILSNSKAKKEEKDLELLHIFDNIGMIMSAYYDTLEICFNQDTEQAKKFIEKNFMFVDEARYFKIYKEKFAKPEIMTIPTVNKISLSDNKQQQLYERFAEIAFRKEPMITKEEKHIFIETLAKHVDNIIENTPCNGEIWKDKQSISWNVGIKKPEKDGNGDPMSQRTLPNGFLSDGNTIPYQLFHGWYFYLTTI